jgi:ABC-2 type transport system permease protein
VIVVMAALGLSMYAFGGLTYYRARKRAPGAPVAAAAG